MSKHPLDSYPNSAGPQGTKRADCGGYCPGDEIDVRKYQPPQGPKGIDHQGPGLGGTNYGNSGTQGLKSFRSESGRPGLGGDRTSNGGVQSKR